MRLYVVLISNKSKYYEVLRDIAKATAKWHVSKELPVWISNSLAAAIFLPSATKAQKCLRLSSAKYWLAPLSRRLLATKSTTAFSETLDVNRFMVMNVSFTDILRQS